MSTVQVQLLQAYLALQALILLNAILAMGSGLRATSIDHNSDSYGAWLPFLRTAHELSCYSRRLSWILAILLAVVLSIMALNTASGTFTFLTGGIFGRQSMLPDEALMTLMQGCSDSLSLSVVRNAAGSNADARDVAYSPRKGTEVDNLYCIASACFACV